MWRSLPESTLAAYSHLETSHCQMQLGVAQKRMTDHDAIYAPSHHLHCCGAATSAEPHTFRLVHFQPRRESLPLPNALLRSHLRMGQHTSSIALRAWYSAQASMDDALRSCNHPKWLTNLWPRLHWCRLGPRTRIATTVTVRWLQHWLFAQLTETCVIVLAAHCI